MREQLRRALAASDRLAYLKAAQATLPREANQIGLERLEDVSPMDLPGQRSPIEEHTLILDYAEEPLEPVYFNLLNELQGRDGWRVEKLVDTVSVTSGSGLFFDLTRRLAMQQQEIAKLLAQLHGQVRALLGRWQKWCEEKRQLAFYDRAREEKDIGSQAATRPFNRRGLEEHDVAGMAAASPGEDGAELRQRLEVDRRLLANELNLLKLQVNWLRPHLKPTQESRHAGDPGLVTAFNTAMFEIVLLVAPHSELEHAVQTGALPKLVLNQRFRQCQPILIVNLRFRVVPERSSRGAYGYRGRAEIMFTSYALNEEELSVFRRELRRSQWGEVLGLLEENTASNLEALLGNLDELLADKQSKEKPPAPVSEDTNPFSALFSWTELFASTPSKADPLTPVEPLRPDNDIERVLRSFALLEARAWCRKLYDHEKQARQMPVWGE